MYKHDMDPNSIINYSRKIPPMQLLSIDNGILLWKIEKIIDIGSLWPHCANATADVSRLQMRCSLSLDCLLEYLHLWNASVHLASETESNCFLDWKQFYKVGLGFPKVVKNIKEPKWV